MWRKSLMNVWWPTLISTLLLVNNSAGRVDFPSKFLGEKLPDGERRTQDTTGRYDWDELIIYYNNGFVILLHTVKATWKGIYYNVLHAQPNKSTKPIFLAAFAIFWRTAYKFINYYALLCPAVLVLMRRVLCKLWTANGSICICGKSSSDDGNGSELDVHIFVHYICVMR